MSLKKLTVFALLSSVLSLRIDGRSGSLGCPCEIETTRQASPISSYWIFLTSLSSSMVPTYSTTSTALTETSTTAESTITTSTSSTYTSTSSTNSPTITSADTPRESALSSAKDCLYPINGCAYGKYIIAQYSVEESRFCQAQCTKNVDCSTYQISMDTENKFRCDLLSAIRSEVLDIALSRQNPTVCGKSFLYMWPC